MTLPPADDAPWLLLREPPDDLCLGFIDTRYWRGMAVPTEQLQVPADLLAWCEATDLWPPAALRRIQAHWQAHPAQAAAALAEALALRETLFRIFAATAMGAAPGTADLAAFNAALAAAPGRASLRLSAEGFAWEVPGAVPDQALLLAPVLWSAGQLLAGRRLARVRQCANPQCRWLFLDDSKSGNRRWCSMATCGNRAKAHRHYAKQREGREVVGAASIRPARGQ
jgi:predicted RNA-binding Zn ribbon-like protein